MTTDDYDDNVRIIRDERSGYGSYLALSQHQRTPAQKHMDHAFDNAIAGAELAIKETEGSLAWMETMGEVPSQFRNMPVLLTQWKAWIAEQKRIKQ